MKKLNQILVSRSGVNLDQLYVVYRDSGVIFAGSLKPSNLRAKFENMAKQGEEEAKKRAEEERQRRLAREQQEKEAAKLREEARLKALKEEDDKVFTSCFWNFFSTKICPLKSILR